MVSSRIKALEELHALARTGRKAATEQLTYNAYLDAESSIWNLIAHLQIAQNELSNSKSSEVIVMVNELLVVSDDAIRIYKEAL
ncbi:hypothetical protein [Aeromonas hydrophila]|uniref:hypothetical protein n=1 Tax=Aeromonas hydrophila TaxID=644 RepID=UPI002B473D34|nr:hypothetical protein [Aeromonas hydrophila]